MKRGAAGDGKAETLHARSKAIGSCRSMVAGMFARESKQQTGSNGMRQAESSPSLWAAGQAFAAGAVKPDDFVADREALRVE